jgi:hypothetical protein
VIKDEQCRCGQKRHSGQRAKVFGTFVAVGMIRIGRSCGDSHGEESDQCRNEIEEGVGALSEQAETSSQRPDNQL